MRYLVDAGVLVVVFLLGWAVFASAALGLLAGLIVAGAWEGLQGKRGKA